MSTDEERVKRAEELAKGLIARMEANHVHKETMAHSALAAMLALLGFVLTATSWPPEWVPKIIVCQRGVAFFGLLVLWGLLHLYM